MRDKKGSGLGWTIFFSIVCALYMYPIVMVVLNSFKQERFISTGTSFALPTAETIPMASWKACSTACSSPSAPLH